MSIPPPPPPPPPPAAIKAPIPATNKALLSSIQKGTKLKKVPEAVKNDRSEVKLANTPINNGPQKPTMNGTNSSAHEKSRGMSQSGPSTNKQFSDIQSVLMNQMSAVNLRKTSVPANIVQPVRPAFKSTAPHPNQINSVTKAPPPPPQTAKPVLRSSMSEQKADYQDNVNKPIVQPPMRKAPQSQPNQVNIARNVSNYTSNGRTSNPGPPPPPLTKKVLEPQKSQPNFSVIRKTPNPPPPLSRGLVEHTKAPFANPPPVPQRVVNPSISIGHATTSQARPVPGPGSSQYKVFDRPPPPPPPLNNSIQSYQKTSFDQRFQFPSEKLFPKPESSATGSRYSQSSGSVEAFSY